jgi:hypothetical protein
MIPLTRGKFAIVDDEDFKRLSKFKWTYSDGYAIRFVGKRGEQKKIYMHREITNAPEDMEVDHVHGNRSDNRKSELRLCTRKQNDTNSTIRSDNTSGFKGVTYRKDRKVWWAQIFHDGHWEFLGSYKSPEDAAKAYDVAATKYFREYAKLNFPH